MSKAGIIVDTSSANERRYIVTSSLIGWTHTQNNPCEKWKKYFIIWSICAAFVHIFCAMSNLDCIVISHTFTQPNIDFVRWSFCWL